MSEAPEILPYGDRGLLVELDSTASVVAWVDAFEAAPPDGVADLVPAARTVLVVAAPGTDLGSLRGHLTGLRVGGEDADVRVAHGEADEIVIEVRYDGPDLADVAGLTGLSEREVVEAHTATAWRVAFGGFAPGFAYLTGGDARLRVPRRESSRTSVPAGSVGLADTFSGVYPRSSPGGWQLIGSTDAPMWDLGQDPPARLRPGAAVRFVEAGTEPGS